jgi:hypothetical protein
MTSPYIDFISAYCDRWCERCPFTDRCSLFAVIDARDDAHTGVPSAPDASATSDAKVSDSGSDADEERRQTIAVLPLTRLSDSYRDRARAWIQAHRTESVIHDDPVMRDAFEIVCWDVFLIGVKLYRALDGQMQHQQDGEVEDVDRVQNDWNGSAKVALRSIERSAEAWRRLGPGMNDPRATGLGAALDHLSRSIIEVFPDARSFVRPGFDQT